MVPVSSVVRSRVMQGMRAGVASWRWSSAVSGASASWPMHQAGQAVVGGVLFSSVWSAGVAIELPSLPLQCVVGLLGESEAEGGRRWKGGGLRENKTTKQPLLTRYAAASINLATANQWCVDLRTIWQQKHIASVHHLA